jgi:hypothetical protein
MNETFRPRSNFLWAGVSLVLIFLFAVNSVLVATSTEQSIIEFAICLILAVIAHLIWIRPKMVLRENHIEVVNPLNTVVIPYTDVIELSTKWSLAISHSRGTTKVWVAPAGGKQRWIADKKFGWLSSDIPLSRSREIEMESMSSSLHSFSGQAAYMIQERIKRTH